MPIDNSTNLLSSSDPATPENVPTLGQLTGLRLHALVLLAGFAREGDFGSGWPRPVLGLPLAAGQSLLRAWTMQAATLIADGDVDRPPIWIAANGQADELRRLAQHEPSTAVMPDRGELRGTAGVLADLARGLPADRFLLVANAHSVLLQPLSDILSAVATRMPADIVMVSQAGGEATGLSLVRVGALADVPDKGFVDFKEQALASIARKHDVRVVNLPGRVQAPVRSRAGLIDAIGLVANAAAGLGTGLLESESKAFAIIEPGAKIDPSARIRRSVVLAGARVDADAVVVRSVLGPGAVVARGTVVVDRVLAGTGAVERT